MSDDAREGRVTACGATFLADGVVRLRPAVPPGVTTETQPVLTLVGADLPAAGLLVSVDGELVGGSLRVAARRQEQVVPGSWESTRHLSGAEQAVSRAAIRSMLDRWREALERMLASRSYRGPA